MVLGRLVRPPRHGRGAFAIRPWWGRQLDRDAAVLVFGEQGGRWMVEGRNVAQVAARVALEVKEFGPCFGPDEIGGSTSDQGVQFISMMW